jgi:hypothetical protein
MDESKPLTTGGSSTARRAPLLTCRGGALQVDPVKPTLKAPGSERLKVKSDVLLSNVAFNFNSHRYTAADHSRRRAAAVDALRHGGTCSPPRRAGLGVPLPRTAAQRHAGKAGYHSRHLVILTTSVKYFVLIRTS